MTERVYPSCPFNNIIACEMKLIRRENPCEGCNNYNEDALIEKVETIWGMLPKEYIDIEEFSMVTTTAVAEAVLCEHTGYYHTVTFLCFKKRFLACENCGKLIPQTKWRLSI